MGKTKPKEQSDVSRVLKGHQGPVVGVVVTPDGTRAVSASLDTTLRVWDLASGESVASLEGHEANVVGVAVTPDGTRAVSASLDMTLRVWDLASGRSVATLKGHTSAVLGVAVTPDGTRAVSASLDMTLRVWDLASGRSVATLKGHEQQVRAVAVTPDGTRAVSTSGDMTLRVWDLASGKSVAVLEGHTGSVRGVALARDAPLAISASRDNTLRVWDLVSGKSIATLKGHTDSVFGVALTRDGTRAVSASLDNTLRVWNVARGKSTAVLEGHTGGVYGVALTRDGTRAVSTSEDETLRVWDLRAIHKASYTNAKVLFVGESGAGKSGLVKRLVHDQPPSGTKSTDAGWATQLVLTHKSKSKVTDQEIWLWDFGGQADYRLIHQLYMDGTALAVFVFDAQKPDAFDKLSAWDRDITRAAGGKPFAKLLVAGKYDVCPPIMTKESIESFRDAHDFAEYIPTSAETKLGCEQLHRAIVKHIQWKALPATLSTPTFRRIKRAILTLKDRLTVKIGTKAQPQPVVVTSAELIEMVRALIPEDATIEEAVLAAVVGLLKAPGAVWPLENSDRVLLEPERLSHYASAVIRTIRDRDDGMGFIPEDDVLNAMNLDYGQLQRLPQSEETHVLRSMYQLLLSRSICLREPRPKGECHLLVFPHLFKLEKPKPDKSNPLVTYRFSGLLDENLRHTGRSLAPYRPGGQEEPLARCGGLRHGERKDARIENDSPGRR